MRSRLREGKYKELRVISELIALGFDVYPAAVDDQGIDCVLRVKRGPCPEYYDVQIKGYKGYNRVVGVTRDDVQKQQDKYLLILAFFHRDGKDEIFFLTREQVLQMKDHALSTGADKGKGWGDLPFNKEERSRFANQKIQHLRRFLGC